MTCDRGALAGAVAGGAVGPAILLPSLTDCESVPVCVSPGCS